MGSKAWSQGMEGFQSELKNFGLYFLDSGEPMKTF